jgi:hypothetical protein
MLSGDAQPPHALTLEKLISELQDALDRDQQFIDRGNEFLGKWKLIAHGMEERIRTVLATDLQAHSSST